MDKNSEQVGKAYAFFDCKASKAEIEAELPTTRRLSQMPSELELSLTEGMDNIDKRIFDKDRRLIPVVQRAKQDRMRYMLEATYPRTTNRETAKHVVGLLYLAHSGSDLFERGEDFRGGVVYEEGSEYHLHE